MHFHLPMTLAAMRETIISQGLMGGEAVDELVSSVVAHLMRPETMTISFSMVQVLGRTANTNGH